MVNLAFSAAFWGDPGAGYPYSSFSILQPRAICQCRTCTADAHFDFCFAGEGDFALRNLARGRAIGQERAIYSVIASASEAIQNVWRYFGSDITPPLVKRHSIFV